MPGRSSSLRHFCCSLLLGLSIAFTVVTATAKVRHRTADDPAENVEMALEDRREFRGAPAPEDKILASFEEDAAAERPNFLEDKLAVEEGEEEGEDEEMEGEEKEAVAEKEAAEKEAAEKEATNKKVEKEIRTTRHRHHARKFAEVRSATFQKDPVLPHQIQSQSNASLHPYMKIIYDEIVAQKHPKWTSMDDARATVRGIEPIRATKDQETNGTILEFVVGSFIHSRHNVHHNLDLVFSQAGDRNSFVDGVYVVEILDSATSQTMVAALAVRPAFRQSPTDRNSHFAVLELKPFLLEGFRSYVDGHRLWPGVLHLRVIGPGILRPLLVFYYVSGEGDTQDKVRRALRSAVERGRARRHANTARLAPRPCKHCVSGVRKKPITTPQTKPVRNANEPCALHEFEVSLEDLRWEGYVVFPSDIKMNFCSGQCKAPIVESQFNATSNAIVRSQLVAQPSHSQLDIPPPYCVPTVLRSVDFLYYQSENHYVIDKMKNLVAEQCGCR